MCSGISWWQFRADQRGSCAACSSVPAIAPSTTRTFESMRPRRRAGWTPPIRCRVMKGSSRAPPIFPMASSWAGHPASLRPCCPMPHRGDCQAAPTSSCSCTCGRRERPKHIAPVIGLYFGDRLPAQTPTMIRLGKQDLDIPPGAAAHAITDSFVLPVAVDVLAIQPHAHYRARSVDAQAILPDGVATPAAPHR